MWALYRHRHTEDRSHSHTHNFTFSDSTMLRHQRRFSHFGWFFLLFPSLSFKRNLLEHKCCLGMCLFVCFHSNWTHSPEYRLLFTLFVFFLLLLLFDWSLYRFLISFRRSCIQIQQKRRWKTNTGIYNNNNWCEFEEEHDTLPSPTSTTNNNHNCINCKFTTTLPGLIHFFLEEFLVRRH